MEACISSRRPALGGRDQSSPYRAPLLTEHLPSAHSVVHGWRLPGSVFTHPPRTSILFGLSSPSAFIGFVMTQPPLPVSLSPSPGHAGGARHMLTQ